MFIPRTKSRIQVQSSARSNNMGFLSDKPYYPARDPAHPEYRIVVLGDSMTGTTTSDIQWVDTLEDLLNQSDEMVNAMKGKRFRLYNLGVPGAGFPTFWQFYEKYGRQFDPDLIVLNYIELDFPRTNLTGYLSHLTLEEEMVKIAAFYVKKLLQEKKPVLTTLMPIYSDFFPNMADYHLTDGLLAAVPEIQVHVMRQRLPWKGKPPKLVAKWYNIPHDGHMSELGGRIYAQSMATLIAEQVAGVTLAFPAVQERGWVAPRRTHEWIVNGDFILWPWGDKHRVSHNPMEVTRGWTAVADGPGGQGEALLSAGENTFDPREGHDISRYFLRFSQQIAASDGTPSIRQIIGSLEGFSGKNMHMSLHARSLKPAELIVMLATKQGAAGSHPAKPLFSQTVTTTRNWQSFKFDVSLPHTTEDMPSRELQMVLRPLDGKVPFTIDVTDISLTMAAESPFPEEDGLVRSAGHTFPVADVMAMRERTRKAFLKARNTSLIPFGFYKLLNRRFTYFDIAPGQKWEYGFLEVVVSNSTTPPVTGYMQIACGSPPLSLSNPNCFHLPNFQVFIKH